MENLDDQIHVSVGFILSGKLSDVKRLRKLILDFIGAELTPEGYLRQPTLSTSLRLIYHTLSRLRLFLIDEREWRILEEVRKK